MARRTGRARTGFGFVGGEEFAARRAPGVSSPRDSRAWAAWLAASGAATAVYFWLPETAQSMLYNAIGLAAAGAMALGMRARRAEPRAGWTLVVLGTLTLAAGDVAYGTYQPVPSAADAFYLSAHAVLAVGLVSVMRRTRRALDRPVLLDAAAIAAAVVAASLLFVQTGGSEVGTVGSAVSIAYPLMDLVLVGLALRLALTARPRQVAHGHLVAGLALLLVADTAFTLQGYGTTYALGSWVDAAWLLSYALMGSALLHPSFSADAIPAAGAAERADSHSGTAMVFAQLRLRRIFARVGMIAMGLAAASLVAGAAWLTPELLFLAGVYGTTGTLMAIASAVHPRWA